MSYRRPKLVLKIPSQKYSSDDCVKVIQDFYAENGRVPTTKEIDALSRQGKSPSKGTFNTRGGLIFLIKKAKLSVVNKKSFVSEEGDIRTRFKNFVSDFRATCGRFPTSGECTKAAKEGECPREMLLKRHTGKYFGEALLSLGAPIRRGKLANLPAGPKWRFK